jgi:hypothetical protein
MLLHRLAARGQGPAMIDKAAREISQALPQVPSEDPNGTSAMLAGLLSSVLDTRFRRRQDLRDIRAGLELTERAIASSPDTPIQRATLLANRGIQLLRLGWASDNRGVTAGHALDAVREAIAIVPVGSSLAYQLQGLLAGGLLVRAMTEGEPQQQTTLQEAWEAVRCAAGEELPNLLSLVVQTALAAVLGNADPQIQADGERALRRLQEVRSEFAYRELPTQLVDIAFALPGDPCHLSRRRRAGPRCGAGQDGGAIAAAERSGCGRPAAWNKAKSSTTRPDPTHQPATKDADTTPSHLHEHHLATNRPEEVQYATRGFALGARGGLARILMPSAVNTASKELVNWLARSLIRNLIVVARWPRSIRKLRLRASSMRRPAVW